MALGNLRLSQEVPEDEILELTNGVTVRSALELLEALKTTDEETFSHHVSEHHHDFAEWLLENYHDDELYERSLKAKQRIKLIRLLTTALKEELKDFAKEEKKKKEKQKISPPKRKKDVLTFIKE